MPSLDQYALTTLANVRDALGAGIPTEAVLEMFYDLASASACTLEVSTEQDDLEVVITSGAEAGIQNFTLGSGVSISQLWTTIDAALDGMYGRVIGPGDNASENLLPFAAKSCFQEANKVELLAENTSEINRAINAISAEIETVCRRKFASRTYSQWFDSDPDGIILPAYPVTAVQRVGVGLRDALKVKYTGAGQMATVRVAVTSDVVVVTLKSTASGTDTSSTLTSTDNATISDLASAIGAVSGWTATVSSGMDSFPTKNLRPNEARDVKDREEWLHLPDERSPSYVVDPEAGLVDLGSNIYPGVRNVFVEYVAGYSTIPYDLAQIATSLVVELLNSQGRDPTLIEEELDQYRYKREGQVAAEGRVRTLEKRLANWINRGPSYGVAG